MRTQTELLFLLMVLLVDAADPTPQVLTPVLILVYDLGVMTK